MNCFVIMPFGPDFDDVYVTIKASVANAILQKECRCFRLDDAKPAGRITERLLQELLSASLCVADITGNRPNVMWEVGYAMALGHPTIVLTQTLADLPFDIRDVQTLQYDRARLSSTLGQPLQQVIIDTMSSHLQVDAPVERDKLVGQLLSEMADLKSMVTQAVHSWNPESAVVQAPPGPGLKNLAGAWVNPDTNTHLYASIAASDLIVPYCYDGDDELIGAYFGWRRTGDYWFARFAWRNREPAGFTFLRQDSIDVLHGAWWSDKENLQSPKAPPEEEGVPVTWVRVRKARFPVWATQFLQEVKRNGLQQSLGPPRHHQA